jgi:hypothetical protein
MGHYDEGLYIVLSIAVGIFASRRRNRSGFGWFVLALIITPLLAFIVCAILRTKPARIAASSPTGAGGSSAAHGGKSSPQDVLDFVARAKKAGKR